MDSTIKILVLIIIVLAVCTLALLAALGVVTIVQNNPSPNPQQTHSTQAETDDLPTNSTVDTSAVLGESADMGQEYIDSMIFLGDSTTYHMINRAVLKDGKNTTQVWSGEACSLTLDGNIHKTTIIYPKTQTPMTIAEAVALEKPAYMVITLGVNGVSFCNETQFTTYYGKLLTAIKIASPDTKIILQSIFPVSAAYDQKENGITNAKINTANTWVMQLAAQHGCKYLDTQSVLKDKGGAMLPAYDSGDGIHMTVDGYKAILQYIRTHGYTE